MTSQAELFPGFQDLPRRERSHWHQLKEISRLSAEHGQLIPRQFAFKILDISSQRVAELIEDSRRFKSWEFFGKIWVCENDLVAYATSERKAGRPFKGKTNKEIWRAASDFAHAK